MKKISRLIQLIILSSVVVTSSLAQHTFVNSQTLTPNATAATMPRLTYRSHVQNIGWMNFVQQGQLSGTTGRSLRLEAFSLQLANLPPGINAQNAIEYRAHVRSIGWQNFVRSGQVAGTTGRSLPVEAIQIRLRGGLERQFDIFYQVHLANIGWLGWARNGNTAGAVNAGAEVQALRIQLVPRGGAAPGVTTRPSISRPTLTYQTHVQNIGWQSMVGNRQIAGTIGRGLRVEAFRASLANTSLSGRIEYNAHVQNIGWQGFVSGNNIAGTVGRSLRMEAIRIRLTGELAQLFDIYYRVYVQHHGWLDWAKNGASAGSAGMSLRIEAIELNLVIRDGFRNANTTRPFLDRAARIRNLDPRRPMVALTFDDGPAAGTTRILNTLDRHGGRASFFVLGSRALANQNIIRDIHRRGHEVLGHSWNHANLTRLSVGNIQNDIIRTHQTIESMVGPTPRMFRAPYGAVNNNVRQAARNTGFALINWSVDPQDWRFRNANTVHQNVMRAVHPGAIVVLHDIHPTTATAMERVIPDLITRGYQIVTVSELLHFSNITPRAGEIYSRGRR